MTSILAYDIDGRPLRAGDRVVLLYAGPRFSSATGFKVGDVFTVNSQPTLEGYVNADELSSLDWVINCKDARKIIANHTPAETGFTELMTNLKTGSLEPLEIE